MADGDSYDKKSVGPPRSDAVILENFLRLVYAQNVLGYHVSILFGKCYIIFLNVSVEATRWFEWNTEKLDVRSLLLKHCSCGEARQALHLQFTKFSQASLRQNCSDLRSGSFNQLQTILQPVHY